jgi:hypothetical protein
VSAPTHPSSNPRFTPQWPTSKGDPIYPCWSYGGRTGMYQADALRMMAHDLVETIRQLTMPFDELIEQSREKEGVDTGVFMTRLWKKVEDQKRELARLNEKLSAADEPKNALDDKSLCDALTEALRHAFVPGMQTADGSPFQFVDLMSDPGTDISTGIDRIESFAENVTDEVMELLPQDSIVTDIKLRSIDEAERIYRAVQPPREGYSQAYADQMRTALLRIAGWREIDRNSLGERLREIEEIALAALMPTVTKETGL